MKRANQEKYILHLPRWYPNTNDPQNGSFVRNHIQAISGQVKSVALYITTIDDNGDDCRVISFEKDNFSEHIVLIPKTPKTPRLLTRFRRIPAMIMGLKAVRKAFGRPALVHVHVLLYPGLVALMLKLFYRIPYIISEHWSGYVNGDFSQRNLFYRFLAWLVIIKSSCSTAVSDFLKNGMLAAGFPNRINIVPNVIHPPLKQIYEKLPAHRINMLVVADLVDRIKNISGIIKALNELKTELPELDLHIIGDGPDREILEKLSIDIGLNGSRIFFHGRMTPKEVYQYYPSCDFVVVNSRFETFSMITAEALVHNKPVIATRCGGPEMFIHEKNGLLIRSDDQPALTESIKTLCTHLENYRNLDFSKEILENYTPEKVGASFYGIYTEVVDLK